MSGRVQSFETAILDKFKDVLTYAGFDLRGDADALTEAEVQQYLPHVTLFAKRLGTAVDWLLTHTNADHQESYIFQFEDEEAEKLALWYLKRAKAIGWMARVARQVKHLEDVGQSADVAGILAKRMLAVGMFYPANGGFKPWIR